MRARGRGVRVRPRPARQDRQGHQRRRRRHRRPDAGAGASEARGALPRAAARADRRPPRRTRPGRLGPREARIAADIDAMVDEALARSRDGNIVHAHVPRPHRRQVDDAPDAGVTYSKAAVVRLLDRVRGPSTATRSTRSWTSTAAASRGPTAATAWRSTPAACTARSTPRSSARPPTARSSRAPHHTQPERSRPTSSPSSTSTRSSSIARLPAEALQAAQAGQDLPDRRRHGRPRDAGRALPHPEQGGESRLDDAELQLGRAGRPRQGRARRHRRNPLKARWLGIFNGAGIHGIDPSEYGTIGHAASHGCVRMRIPDVMTSTRASPSARRSTSPSAATPGSAAAASGGR